MEVKRSVKVAVAQMTSGNQLERNLEKMRLWTETAAKQGAEIVVFPEMAYFMGAKPECAAVVQKFSELIQTFAGWAKEFKITLLPGSLREPGTNRPFNTLPVLTPDGKVATSYRKIFLFKAQLPDRVYNEGQECQPGSNPILWKNLGLAICYDLRFPELFRALKKQGAEILVVPAAFTVPTGEAHWSVLLRARAIENQCFVVAPAQTGKLGDNRLTYGHSQVISPWGEVLLDLQDKEGFAVAELDVSALDEARKRVDSWASRREDLFPI